MSERVIGQCPMGCGETLFVGAGGYVTCGYLPCPNPTLASDLMRLLPLIAHAVSETARVSDALRAAGVAA